jgi:hypothetical protein
MTVKKKPAGYGGAAYKSAAVRAVKAWLDGRLRGHDEPQRAGTRRGDRIGFPKKKLAAAGLLVLHPFLELKEIAALTEDVSLGVLQVWRTQERFRREEIDLARTLGRDLALIVVRAAMAGRLELQKVSGTKHILPDRKERRPYGHIHVPLSLLKANPKGFDRLFPQGGDTKQDTEDIKTRRREPTLNIVHEALVVLSWLNKNAVEAFSEVITEHINGPSAPAPLLFLFGILLPGEDDPARRRRGRAIEPGMAKLWKRTVELTIDRLADPEFHKTVGERKVRELAERLKKHVTQAFDLAMFSGSAHPAKR